MTDRDPPNDGPPQLTIVEPLDGETPPPASHETAGDFDPEAADTNTRADPLNERTLARGAANDEAILVRIALLEEDHNDLAQAIEALEALPRHDRLSVARLKKKKLQIKDKIQTLKNTLTPDIIA